jgi:hypothetical protein
MEARASGFMTSQMLHVLQELGIAELLKDGAKGP